MKVYLDNAATTPLEPEVIEVMHQLMQKNFGNPSSIHALGRQARSLIEEARKTVANCLNASTGEIFFTSCATESNNMVIQCAIRDLGVKRIISSPAEHDNVLNVLKKIESKSEIQISWLDLDGNGNIDFEQLENLLTSEVPTLVSLMHVNNEIGTVLDMSKIGELCKENGAYFHSDTVQSIGKFDINLQETNVHFITGSAHKFYGPKGVGFLYINDEIQINPVLLGGSQERNMRAGTENIYGIVGMAKALELATRDMQTRREIIENLRAYFKTKLVEELPDVSFNGNQADRYHYGILNVSLPKSSTTDMLMLNLDIAGICASSGSACSSGVEHVSHVMAAIKADTSRTSVRFSLSHQNTTEEIDYTVAQLKRILKI